MSAAEAFSFRFVGKQEIENLAQLLPVAHQNEAACAADAARISPRFALALVAQRG